MKYAFKGFDLDIVLEAAVERGKCEVDRWYAFPQVWGSTTLGFGGIGGQAITRAQTVVVFNEDGNAYVFFSGRFAYSVERPNEKFVEALGRGRMPPVFEADELNDPRPVEALGK